MPTHIHRSRLPILFTSVLLLVAVFVPLPSAKADVTFVVDTVADIPALSACTAAPDDCSLRGAIDAANVTAGTDTIEFLIPAAQCPGGICTITLTNGPIGITEAVTIDATTQPQHSGPSANVCATATQPSHMRVELVAAPTGGYSTGFSINHSGASAIRGLAFGTDIDGVAVDSTIVMVAGSGHHISCNHFGVDAAGSAELGLSMPQIQVAIEGAASDVTIGTDGDGVDDIGERNVIGPGGFAVFINGNGNNNNTIAGNYIGFFADGATASGAGMIQVRQESSNTIIGTDGDGISDELERNYFGSRRGVFLQGHASGSTNNIVAGNTFGAGPDGATTPVISAIEIVDLRTSTTGYEVTDNTIFTSDTGVGLAISGDPRTSTVLVDGNSFGVVGGSFPQNGQAILLGDAGASVVSNNLITGSHAEGLAVRGDATLAAGSVGNCIVGNVSGMVNDASSPVTFENNWWGSINGPSGNGSGTGDTVSIDVDFAPWLTNPADIATRHRCSTTTHSRSTLAPRSGLWWGLRP